MNSKPSPTTISLVYAKLLTMEAAIPLPTAPPINSAVNSAAIYSDSANSSPRSLHTDAWDGDPPILRQKLRFMCSYGGHIIPRPHDKSLCYIGGDTRIIVIDRNTSLLDLRQRLSKTLLQNQPFLLKYQLPNEELDALISVTSNEDLEIMVEEYDRLNNAVAGGGLKPGRLRLFLFPKSASNIEQLLVGTVSTKSDDWFLNALNGTTTTLSAAASDRGFSESSSVNCLLGLDDDIVGKFAAVAVGKGAESQTNAGLKNDGSGNEVINNNNHEVHSIPGSPKPETTSSFGSTSSSPSSSNIPPIKVLSEESPKAEITGISEQFQHMGIGVGGNVNSLPQLQKQEEVGCFPPSGTVFSGLPSAAGLECGGRTVSDDERSDYRKIPQIQQLMPPAPQQIANFLPKTAVWSDFPSPDSISSEGSVTNPPCRQRQPIFQESLTQIVPGNYGAVADRVTSTSEDQNTNRFPMQTQVQDPGYMMANQFDQNHLQFHQQPHFVHMGVPHYIHSGAVPIASYYPIYPTQQQHPHQPELDQQQYPFYFMPTRPVQAFNLPLQQTNYSEMAPTASSIRPHTSPAVVASHGTLHQGRNAPTSNPELVGVYRTAAAPAPQLIQVPPGQHQAQYVGFTQIHHPSQSVAQSPAASSAYTYEFGDSAGSHVNYTQPLPPQLDAQYQTMAPAPGMALPDSSAQLDNIKH